MPPDPDALAALRSALPWWGHHGLAPLLVVSAFGLSLGVTLLALRLAGGGLRRLPPDAPWAERARAVHPTHLAAALGMLVPCVSLEVLLRGIQGPLFSEHALAWSAALAVAGYLGAAVARRALHRWIHGRPQRLRALLRSDALVLALLLPQLVVLAATVVWVRPPFGAGDALALAVGAAAMVGVAVCGGVPLLRLVGWVRPGGERLQELAAQVSARVGVPVRGIEQVTWDHANAFAMPLTGRLLVTTGACEALDDEALAAILAHELGHLSESRGARLARLLGSLVLLPVAALPLLIHAWGWRGAAGLALLLLLALAGLQRMARRLEQRADCVAHDDESVPGRYARALESLHRANQIPAVLGRRRPHPDLYDRMSAAGATPAYPRPAPPSRLREVAALLAALVPSLAAVVVLGVAPALAPVLWNDEGGVRAATAHVIATSGAGSATVLAMALDRDDRDVQALAASTAAVHLASGDPTTWRLHAHLLARAGRCEAAARAAHEAERRVSEADPWTRAHWRETRLVWPADCPASRTAALP